ncbi:MAG: hypothetical protein ACT4PL_10845 [Phycisphaerales bacterium]
MALMLCAGSIDAQVHLRGQRTAVPGEVTKVGREGVTITVRTPDAEPPLPKATTTIISWDKVREVRGDLGAESAPFLAVGGLADDLWRVRARLERGDRPGAGPIVDGLMEKSRGLGGPSGVVLAECVMRTRLAEGRMAGALWAYFDLSALTMGAPRKERETWRGTEIRLPAVVDVSRGLAPRVAPVFSIAAQGPAVRAIAESSEWSRTQGVDAFTRDLAATYRSAAMWELAAAEATEPEKTARPALPENSGGDDALALVQDIVRARTGNAEERAAARGRLRKRIEGLASAAEGDSSAIDVPSGARYVEAWCRVGIGRSMLREPGLAERRLAVVELLHLPARFADVTPELAVIALAEGAAALEALGDIAGARRLGDELRVFVGELPTADALDPHAPDPDETAG